MPEASPSSGGDGRPVPRRSASSVPESAAAASAQKSSRKSTTTTGKNGKTTRSRAPRAAAARPPRRAAGGGGPSSSTPTPSGGGDGHLFRLLVVLVLAVAAFDVGMYVAYRDDPILNSVGSGHTGSLGLGGEHRHPVDGRKFVRRREEEEEHAGGEQAAAGSDGMARAKAGTGAGERKGDKDDAESSQRRLVELMEKAGVTLTDDDRAHLPSWSAITSMYGPEPIIVGLDTCPKFRATITPSEAYIGPAGIFNTGTNLLAELLKANCRLPRRAEKYGGKTARGDGQKKSGMRWQVPWGKHRPADERLHNVADADKEAGDIVEQRDVLPVVTVKDPYGWMGSMCRHTYAANWNHDEGHCPNLVPSEVDRKRGFRDIGKDGAVPVRVRFSQTKVTSHDSLAGLWNDWYGLYQDAGTEYPRLIVRFEDLLLHTEEVVTKVCECGGGELVHDTFKYVSQSAKGQRGPHQGSSGLLGALVRYGDPKKRVEGMTREDLEYARGALRSDLMEAYGYAHPEQSVAEAAA